MQLCLLCFLVLACVALFVSLKLISSWHQRAERRSYKCQHIWPISRILHQQTTRCCLWLVVMEREKIETLRMCGTLERSCLEVHLLILLTLSFSCTLCVKLPTLQLLFVQTSVRASKQCQYSGPQQNPSNFTVATSLG